MMTELEMANRREAVNRKQEAARSGLRLVAKAAAPARGGLTLVRCRGERTVARIWAVAEAEAAPVAVKKPAASVRLLDAPGSRPKVELAFYRKYTEALLRRYVKLANESGKTPVLLGRELFRGNVTNYQVKSFEDSVVFCVDVERCLLRLDQGQQAVVRRVALQRYSQGEAAAVLGLSLRTVVRQYAKALDCLTEMLLESRLLEPLGSCQ